MEGNDLARYRRAIAYLDELASTPLGADYMRDQSRPWIFLKRTHSFLDLIGNPEKGFKYVHITGTSGKGTVATMTHEALVAAGKRSGLFTSPFVVAATEKIRVNDLYIAADEFAEILETLTPHIEKARESGAYGRPTYFEIFFAIALLYFKRQKCEWVVLEVGAGGRYDATNIITRPVATAITNIDYDHMQILGKTLSKIADSKAGIIKKGSILFTTEKRTAILKLFNTECEKLGAAYRPLPVSDDYQENNKALVRAICEHIGLSEAAIEMGTKARLPGRFETMQEEPLIILDGAHNRSKMRSTVANLKKISFAKLHLIVGFKDDKDIKAILADIVPLAAHVYATRFQSHTYKSVDPNAISHECNSSDKRGISVNVFENSHNALAAARSAAAPDDLILITGSFYLAGELRREWYSEEWVVKNRRSFA